MYIPFSLRHWLVRKLINAEIKTVSIDQNLRVRFLSHVPNDGNWHHLLAEVELWANRADNVEVAEAKVYLNGKLVKHYPLAAAKMRGLREVDDGRQV